MLNSFPPQPKGSWHDSTFPYSSSARTGDRGRPGDRRHRRGRAAPAPGYTWHAEYFYQDQCSTEGSLGVANHEWTSFYCTWTPFNPGFTGSGILGAADLYVN